MPHQTYKLKKHYCKDCKDLDELFVLPVLIKRRFRADEDRPINVKSCDGMLYLECPRCGARTMEYPKAGPAYDDWNDDLTFYCGKRNGYIIRRSRK